MDYLDLNPPIDPKAYSNGKSLLIKKDQPDWTADRYCSFFLRGARPSFLPTRRPLIELDW
jgi:hypothetical protein